MKGLGRIRFAARLACVLAACVAGRPASAQGQDLGDTFRIHSEGVPDSVTASVAADLSRARARIMEELGPFPDTVSVWILPSREAFTAALSEAWGIRETACWMVGGADDHSLFLLSPGVWGDEACEHDPGDPEHRQMIVTHEAVHVYHGQVNPSPDIGLLEEIGWFVEGLATYVSGQLEASHAGRAAEAVETGVAPERLADAWSGPYRYAVSGSMVRFIDERWGRETLNEALHEQTEAEVLDVLGVSEEAFVGGWEAWTRDDPVKKRR